MFQRYKKLTFLILIAAFLLVFPFVGNTVFAQPGAASSTCNEDKDCKAFRTEQGWKGVRCVGGVEDAEKQAGRCIEAPAAGTDLPKGPQKAGEILDILDLVTDWIFAIAMAVALIYLVLAGFQFVTGGGDPAQVTAARQKLIFAFIGIAIALISAGFPQILRTIVT